MNKYLEKLAAIGSKAYKELSTVASLSGNPFLSKAVANLNKKHGPSAMGKSILKGTHQVRKPAAIGQLKTASDITIRTPHRGRMTDFEANKYLTKLQPQQLAWEAVERSGLTGAAAGLGLGLIGGGKGIKSRLTSGVKTGLLIGGLNAGAAGSVTYNQSKRKGKKEFEAYQEYRSRFPKNG
jgi:hypothetical protein